jgi:hypothetical protein
MVVCLQEGADGVAITECLGVLQGALVDTPGMERLQVDLSSSSSISAKHCPKFGQIITNKPKSFT